MDKVVGAGMCCACDRHTDGRRRETVYGAFLCDACFDAADKCPGCGRATLPKFQYGDGRCGLCHR